jgi:DNA-binding winged helix-turn-helix (wHTH) protein
MLGRGPERLVAKRVRLGAFEAQLGSGELFHDGRRIPLQRQPFELLTILIERAGELVTRDELRARLWPDGTTVDFEHSVNTAVRKVRCALGDSAKRPRYIETLAGRGYRLCVPAERCAPRADGSRDAPVRE